MTYPQFLFLLGFIWLAPHMPKQFAFIGGATMLIVASAIGLGWKP